jgi:hypothetical protein
MMPKSLAVAAAQLADVLDRENVALRSMDLRRAMTLLPEKTAAIADLVASAEGKPEPSDPVLLVAVRRLDRFAADNRRLLERAILAQQRLIGIVVRAVASVVVAPSYGAKGRVARPAGPMTFSTRA